MNWKKSLVVSISVLAMICSEQVIQACSDYNNYDTYPQFFGNKISHKPAFKPFQFVEDDLYYDGDWWFGNGGTENPSSEDIAKKIMLHEWQQFVGNDVAVIDIDSALFGSASDALFESLKKGNTVSKQWDNNSFVRFLIRKSNKNTLAYLVYAKACEAKALLNQEDWSDTPQAPSKESYTDLIETGKELYKTADKPFLKMKYAFQILRMAFYNKAYEDVLGYYKIYVAGNEDRSLACTRNIGFKAGAYYRSKRKTEAGYWYTKMFDNSDAYKYEAMLSFEWARKQEDKENGSQIEDRFSKILNLCQNNHERAVVYVMKALRTLEYDLEDIQKAYALDPKVQGIDVLMNREINKLENNYFSFKTYASNRLGEPKLWYHNIRSYQYTQDANIDSLSKIYQPRIAAISNFATLLMNENKAGTAAMWHLAKAYLFGMQDQPNAMQAALASAKAAGMSTSEKTVYDMVNLLATLYQHQNINAETEKAILPQLIALNALAKSNHFANYQFRDVMQHVIAGKYFQQGDTTKGIYAMAHAQTWDTARASFQADHDFQDLQGEVLAAMSIASLRKVQDFRNATAKSAFENWLVSATYYTAEVLKDLEGTIYLRDYDFANAAQIFSQIDYRQEEYANPFMPQINDYLRIYHHDTLKRYTKLSFSKRMAELQRIIAQNPNDAGALYGYAVALYNISYYGKSADIVAYNRIATDNKGYYKDKSDATMPRGWQEYYRVYAAEQYFNKAAAATTDKELKAKALWGAAKCWTKRCPTTNADAQSHYYYDDAYYQNALKNPYFTKLNQGYAQTKFIEKVKGSCSYYTHYLPKN